MAEAAVKDKDVLGLADDDLPDFEVIEDASLAGKPDQMRFERPGEDDEDEGHAQGGQVDEARDERLNADEDDGVDDNRREARKNQKTIRRLARERDRLKIQTMEREIQELKRGGEQMAERVHSQDLYIIDQKLNEATEYGRRADYAYDQASAKQDTGAMSEARRHQEAARNALNNLTTLKQRVGPKPEPARATVDPEIRVKAQRFIQDEAPWYDPAAQDPDSRVLAAIDVKLSAEGYDAKTDEYWSEMRRRGAQMLPGRFRSARADRRQERDQDDEDDDRGSRRRDAAVGVGSDRGRGPRNGAGKVVVRLSPERVKALQDTGEWEDPKARAKAIRDYQKYDQAGRAARQ